ncbi:Hypothetical predicted protein [Xyrichtys novacula]|uniref:Bifunctional lysine-specific demethylase and histidyl-hydroxylase n=1 Tax=Xyrichtys novacula TaxID=13765 RepID=A0AAV1FVN1_XYRNO|nr:Hypothetical predicted protein [Xyrichtys novacula]
MNKCRWCDICSKEKPGNALPDDFEQLLPEGYCHLLCMHTPMEESGFTAYVKLQLITREEAETWLEDFQQSSKVTLRVAKTYPITEDAVRRNSYRVDLRCRHSRGQTAHSQRNTHCPAGVYLVLKKQTHSQKRKSRSSDAHIQEGLLLHVTIKHHHNHPLGCFEVLQQRDVGAGFSRQNHDVRCDSLISSLVSPSLQLKMPKKRKIKTQSGEDEQLPPKQSRVEPSNPPSPLNFHSPADLFSSLLQPLDSETFFREFWEKKPLHLQRSDPLTASYYKSLFQLSDLQTLCSQGLQYYRDVNVVRCIKGQKKDLNQEGRVKHTVLNKNLDQDKATIQFHQPQRFKDELWKIQEKLECFFGALVGSNIYITPEDSQGLPAHYDDVEVFILQLEGQKRWRLYNPTVPLATEYCVEPEDRIGSPTHEITLKEGDLLYFPRGTIHQASTPPGVHHSTHLTLSTYQRMSWGDLLSNVIPSMLCDRSKTDVSLREGMPRQLLLGSSGSEDTCKRLAAHLRALADVMDTGKQEVKCAHLKRDFIMNRLPPYSQELIQPMGRIPALEDLVCLRFKDHIVITVEPPQQRTDVDTEQVVFVLHSLKNQRENHMTGEYEEQEISRGLQFPLSHLRALQQLQQEEQVSVAQLQLSSQEDKLNLVLALWSESLLEAL